MNALVCLELAFRLRVVSVKGEITVYRKYLCHQGRGVVHFCDIGSYLLEPISDPTFFFGVCWLEDSQLCEIKALTCHHI